MLDFIRGIVRPAVTFGLVAAFIAAAFIDKEASKEIGIPASLVLGWWFAARDNKPPPAP
ncbi:MAG: hypothetical protein O3A25_19610 [Acidobacteria bacterium]|nr:hypothetical protein [Acidobacteriota bacterium]